MLSTSFWTLISRIGFACFFSDACNRRKSKPTHVIRTARAGKKTEKGRRALWEKNREGTALGVVHLRKAAHHGKIREAAAAPAAEVRWFCRAVRGGGGGGSG
jgi:hypothetical protein